MSADARAVVVEFGGKSYIRFFAGYYYTDGKNIAVNGVTGLEKSPGADDFFVFDGAPVRSIQKITPPQKITTKYELRDDLRGAAKENTISVDVYRSMSPDDQTLYRAVNEDIPRKAEDVPFVIQKEKGPPSKLPQGVFCTDKNYFARFPSFHHLGPVRASSKYVLYRLAERFQQIIANNPYVKNGSHGIPADPKKEYLGSSYRDSFFIDIRPMTVNGIEVTAKGLPTMFTSDATDQRLSYAHVVRAIDGDNLADLESKIVAYVERETAKHQKWTQPDKCPCCQRKLTRRDMGRRP